MRRSINEDLTKNDVKSITKAEINNFIKQQEFKKAVKEITADTIKNLYKVLWQNPTWFTRVK